MSKSPSLRRIQADVRELAMDPSDRYHAAPLENDMFEWHFTIRGADGTDFEGGIYHGRILLPPEYPFKPPHIVFLTPSGRFETNTKICLSFSAFHPELWQPAWGIRLILEALIAFLPTPADGAIGSLNWTSEERKRLAKKSQSFYCPRCGHVAGLLPELKKERPAGSLRFQKEIEQLRLAQIANEANNDKNKNGEQTSAKAGEGNVESEEPPKKDEVEEQGTKEECTEGELIVEPTPVPEQVESSPTGTTADVAPREAQTPELREAEPLQAQTPAQPESAAARRTGATAAQLLPRNMDALDGIAWITDPVLNLTIVLLAIICFLLFHKARLMFDELRDLNTEILHFQQQQSS